MIRSLAVLAAPLALAVATVPPASSPTPPAPGGSTPTASGPAPTPARTISELLALGRPIVLAHTGGEQAYPGSTLYSFGESVKAGADMLDLNVMLSKDDQLVVQHDGTVDRLTDATGEVVSMTYAELAKLDNAYWFTAHCEACRDAPAGDYVWRGVRTGAKPAPPGYSPDDFAIPTLDQLIARFPGVPLNIEIEEEGDGLRTAKVLADVLARTNMLDRVVVTSFGDEVNAEFHRLAPTVTMSPSKGPTVQWVLGRIPLPDGMRILQLPQAYNGLEVITPKQVADAHRAGYLIWVWPNDAKLETLDSYRHYVAMGIDGLNINVPADGVRALTP